MDKLPRLNGIIGALEKGGPAFSAFAPMDIQTAMAMAASKYDGVVYEGEHLPWDIVALRDSLQFMIDRRKVADSGSIAPPTRAGAGRARCHDRAGGFGDVGHGGVLPFLPS